ncbi:MAG: hypothetical protein KC910_05880 [Candidatus Eremiobacteraeota bacterium]|nr:hypothetical protein [Candidatus Eremiobacteraeota bacterium]
MKEDLAANRRAGVIQALVAGLVGGLSFHFWRVEVAYVAFGFCGLFLVAGLFSPGGLYPAIRRVFDGFGRVVGKVLTWLLLIPTYWLFFTPFHLLFRSGGRDAMARKLDKDASSYWIERSGEVPDPDSYERQFR